MRNATFIFRGSLLLALMTLASGWLIGTVAASTNGGILAAPPACDTAVVVQFYVCDTDGDGQLGPVYFAGQVLTAAGSYTATLTRQNGCDSVVTLVLSAIETSRVHLQLSLCDGDGDGVLDSVEVAGTRIGNEGNYTFLFSNHLGCDSVISAEVSRRRRIVRITSSVGDSVAGVRISADTTFERSFVPAGATCDSVITYRVRLRTTSGIGGGLPEGKLSLYPNPTTEAAGIWVRLPELTVATSVLIYDGMGRLLRSIPIARGTTEVWVPGQVLPRGAYTVIVAEAGAVWRARGVNAG